MTIQKRREHFKNSVLTNGVVLPGAFNALTAMQIEETGFEGLYISGAALSAGAGLPDIGLLTLSEFSFFIKYITQSVSIPCIADADTGFGAVVNITRTVKELESVGLFGIHIEDQLMPKRCGHLKGKKLVSIEEMVQKIQAACLSRRDTNFLIIARTDARSVGGIDEAIKRALEYVKAGADAIFPEALQTKEEFEFFAKEVKVPLLANMTEFGVSPLLNCNELFSMGYRIIIFPVTALRVAMKNTKSLYQEIKKNGTQLDYLNKMQTRDELYDLIKYDSYANLDDKVANYKNKNDESK
jgi:methylisocitrate lyase